MGSNWQVLDLETCESEIIRINKEIEKYSKKDTVRSRSKIKN